MHVLGASVNCKAGSGSTAYFYAEEPEVKSLLRAAGNVFARCCKEGFCACRALHYVIVLVGFTKVLFNTRRIILVLLRH